MCIKRCRCKLCCHTRDSVKIVLRFRIPRMTHFPMPKLQQGLPPVRGAQQQHALVSSASPSQHCTDAHARLWIGGCSSSHVLASTHAKAKLRKSFAGNVQKFFQTIFSLAKTANGLAQISSGMGLCNDSMPTSYDQVNGTLAAYVQSQWVSAVSQLPILLLWSHTDVSCMCRYPCHLA